MRCVLSLMAPQVQPCAYHDDLIRGPPHQGRQLPQLPGCRLYPRQECGPAALQSGCGRGCACRQPGSAGALARPCAPAPGRCRPSRTAHTALRPTAVSPNPPVLLLMQTWGTVIHERHPHVQGCRWRSGPEQDKYIWRCLAQLHRLPLLVTRLSAVREDLEMRKSAVNAWRTSDAERDAANAQVLPAVLCIGLQCPAEDHIWSEALRGNLQSFSSLTPLHGGLARRVEYGSSS